jgi:hypothetical protein
MYRAIECPGLPRHKVVCRSPAKKPSTRLSSMLNERLLCSLFVCLSICRDAVSGACPRRDQKSGGWRVVRARGSGRVVSERMNVVGRRRCGNSSNGTSDQGWEKRQATTPCFAVVGLVGLSDAAPRRMAEASGGRREQASEGLSVREQASERALALSECDRPVSGRRRAPGIRL